MLGELDDSWSAFDSALTTARRGNLCLGAAEMRTAQISLTGIRAQIAGAAAAFEEELATSRPFDVEDCRLPDAPPECETGADHMEDDSTLMSLWLAEKASSDLENALLEARELFETACAQATPGDAAQGIIIEMEPDRGRFFLDDGTYVAIADGADLPPDIYPGREVFVGGTRYGLSILTDAVSTVGLATSLADFLDYDACVELKFVPVQRFAPISPGPYIMHDPEGYQYENGKYRIEKGMRLGARDIPFCGDSFGPFIVRYSLHLTLTYVDRVTDWTEITILATEFDGFDEPLPLPGRIKHGTDATLQVSYQRQSCESISLTGPNRAPGGDSYLSCSEIEEYGSDEWTLRVYDRGTFCNALYDETDFPLEDVATTTFEPTHVVGKQTILVVPDAGTNMSFVAEGYEVYGPNSSSYPALKRIDEGEQFAVFEHDCVTTPGALYVEEACGTTQASGLRFPRLEGERNGKPFSYSCRVPRVVRDLVDYCPSPPDSFYKLPFSGGWPQWIMSQGNNGSFTHNGGQAYAFDFAADQGTVIRAARAGTVTFVREDQTGNSYYFPDCEDCSANAVNVRHQDGTNSQYFHFVTNGVYVSEGQEIRRGQAIGEVGNTGYSTGPHLHFQARFAGSDTHPVRFRSADNPQTTPPFGCYIPQTGDTLFSDND